MLLAAHKCAFSLACQPRVGLLATMPGDRDKLLPPPGAYPVTVEAGGKLRRDELLVGEETLRLAEWNGGDCGGVLITFI